MRIKSQQCDNKLEKVLRRLKYFNFLMNKQDLFCTCMMFDLMCPSDHVTIIMPVGFKTKLKKKN